MALRQVLTTRTVYVGGGGEGSTSTIDTIALYARVLLSDTITQTATDSLALYAKVGLNDASPGQGDDISLYAKVNLADTAAAQADALNKLALTTADTAGAQSDDYRLGLGLPDANATPSDVLNLGTTLPDTSPGQSDALNGLALGIADANDTPADALTALALAGLIDSNAAPTDTVRTGFMGSGLSDTSGTPSESRSTLVSTWAGSQTNSNTSNPANALGQNNGTEAVCAGTTGLGAANGTLTLTIPVASIPAAGAKVLRIYARLNEGLLLVSTCTYSNTGGSPASGTVSIASGGAAGSFTDVPLTTIGTSLTVSFTAIGSLLANSTWYVDAVGVRSSNPF